VSLLICLACVSMALKPGHAIAGEEAAEAVGDGPDSISRRIRTRGFPSIFEA
jgi:hypothetical protein